MVLLSLYIAVCLGKPEAPLMDDFIGLNTHTVQFRPDLYQPVAKLIRNYHPVEWDLGGNPGEAVTFPKAKNGVDWTSLYGEWRKKGFVNDASLMFESIKAEKWADIFTQAFTYGAAFGKFFGDGLVEAAEIGNEPVDFSDEQYRSMFESMARGIRSTAPKMLIAPCAVAVGKEDKYSRDVAVLTGLEKLYDVLNIHTYAFAEQWPTWRRSYPEDPKISYLEQVRKIQKWRDEHAPGKQIWITEFGYDASTKPAPATGDFTKWVDVSDEQQAQYIVRSYAVFSRMQVDRAYLYWFNDEDSPQLHGSSGLTRNYVPKPSYYAVAHMRKVLGGYRFSKALVEKPGDLFVYEYRKPASNERILMMWSPTGIGRKATVPYDLTDENVYRMETMPLTMAPASVALRFSPRTGFRGTVGEAPTYVFIRD